jgi:hypothetical protein
MATGAVGPAVKRAESAGSADNFPAKRRSEVFLRGIRRTIKTVVGSMR